MVSATLRHKEKFHVKQYEYVTVHMNRFIGSKSEEHRSIIDQYAQKGYRYVGFIPVTMNDYGKYKDIDLVFERDVAN